MGDSSVTRFLEIEEEATRLVEELTRLRQETESYASAKNAIGTAGEQVASAAGALQRTAESSVAVVQSLREIGTPELLTNQQAMEARIETVGETLNEGIGQLSEQISEVSSAVSELRKSLGTALVELQKSSSTIRNTVLAVALGLAAVIVAVQLLL